MRNTLWLIGARIASRLKEKHSKGREREEIRQKFESLSPDQKRILWRYIDNDSSTEKFFTFVSQNEELRGDLESLVGLGMLNRQSIGVYSIKPWTKNFLKENPEILREVGGGYTGGVGRGTKK